MNMKKISCAAAAALLIGSVPVSAADASDQVLMMYVNSYAAYLNGEYIQIDQNYQVTPVIVNDRTLIPARFTGEVFGCEVAWDGAKNEVTISNDETEIKAVINENEMTVNGEKQTLDVPAQILNDRTVLPLRAVAEALGQTVGYNSGLIAVGDKDAVETAVSGNVDEVAASRFKSNMRLSRELKRYTPIYEFSNVVEYNNGVMMSDIPATNGGFRWQRGNVSYVDLPIDEGADWPNWAYNYTIYNNRLFYTIGEHGSSMDWPATIYSCRLDGSDIQLVADRTACDGARIVDGKLYYTEYYDFDGEFYIEYYGPGDGNIIALDLATGQKEILVKGKPEGGEDAQQKCDIYDMYDNVMIYTRGWDDYYWYDLVTGDSGRVNKEYLPPYHYSNAECDLFFYTDTYSHELRVYNAVSGEDQCIFSSDNYISISNVTDNYIYCQEDISNPGGWNNISMIHRIERPDV